jgi:hypothetical protein
VHALRTPFRGTATTEENRSRRRQVGDLEQDEHRIAPVHGEGADEQAAHKPHGPRAAADARGTLLPPQMNYLRHVSGDRDRDPRDAKNLKQGRHRVPRMTPRAKLHKRLSL